MTAWTLYTIAHPLGMGGAFRWVGSSTRASFRWLWGWGGPCIVPVRTKAIADACPVLL